MDEIILDGIMKIEKELGGLSSAQKILLATDGSVTTILDVLKGHVKIKTLIQEFRDADENVATLLNIKEGDPVNYRVVVIQRDEPLIHAVSLIPVGRLNNDFKEDLIRADIPIGRILKKHQIESRREIKSVTVEKTRPEIAEIFDDEAPVLSRTYNIVHKNQVLVWIKETFPSTLFRE
ncbi:MAG: chorismate lyase [Methanobacteriaceae archaeon]|nr:chorismate lyase [Methanobacteriaceae archaeon]